VDSDLTGDLRAKVEESWTLPTVEYSGGFSDKNSFVVEKFKSNSLRSVEVEIVISGQEFLCKMARYKNIWEGGGSKRNVSK
jgi:hypothetical protein